MSSLATVGPVTLGVTKQIVTSTSASNYTTPYPTATTVFVSTTSDIYLVNAVVASAGPTNLLLPARATIMINVNAGDAIAAIALTAAGIVSCTTVKAAAFN